MFNSQTIAVFLTLGMAVSSLAVAEKTQILPGSPFASPTSPRPSIESVNTVTERQYAPTINLLITVRALYDVSRTAKITRSFTLAELKRLQSVLDALPRLERLSVVDALEKEQLLQTAMSAGNWQRVISARERLEKNADMIMASSRIARDESLPSSSEIRLSFLVPGGQAILTRLKLEREFNPFRQGVPLNILKKLLDNIK